MASVQEPEVQFAQRLASNERPVRTKAMKKLRKYVSVRSQKATGGFTGDELLKLWKGLFYCLWMQDKPLLQEELSSQISGLIHCFQDVDGQFLYLESSLQTLKREWTGIDRLRMDKFFQLVRFMFRQTFELLRRRSWESSVVSRFLELLKAQILQAGSAAPSGLQIHILDLYMTELAAVGSAELTAEQNLIFIEPFCKTAAKTKDGTLFRSICSNIFSTIIDQAPFAIEDLMKELKAAEASDSDSGQVSEEDEEEEKCGEKKKSKPGNKRINGKKAKEEDEEDDELLHSEESDTEAPCDEDFGPVLQFDYAALADKLFELSSRSGTPSQNRKRLYRIVRVLRDLSEGTFPQDEYPEEVSTDEDDDMFGSRKRMKRRGGHVEEEEDGAPASKKSKGKKKEASALGKQNKDSAKDEPADLTANNEKKKKKRKKKKKKVQAGGENAQKSEQELMGAVADTEGAPQEALISISSVKEGQSETLLLTEETSHPPICTTAHQDRSDKASENGTKTSELKPAVQQQTPAPDGSSGAAASEKKNKKNKKGTKLQTDESQVSAEAEITPVPVNETEPTTPGRKKKKSQNGERNVEEVEDESQANGVSVEEDSPATGLEKPTSKSKKSKKKKPKADSQGEPEITSVGEGQPSDASTVPIEKKKETPEAPPAADESTETPQKKKKKKKNRAESKTTAAESETPRMADDGEPVTTTTPAKKKKKKASAAQADGSEDQTQVQEAKKRKRKIPVVFEFEADELQAATSINGLAEEEAVGKKTKLHSDVGVSSTPLSTKKSQKKAKTPSASSASDFITFQSNAAVPTPLFCRTKGGPSTPLSSNKKSQTPKSESKKVTFGLKNNKTAEFRKSDRSLLVSPDGSSRVPFDPKQKPKSGVLKSPATPLSTKVKKTPIGSRKTSLSTPKSLPKRRPAAADFF